MALNADALVDLSTVKTALSISGSAHDARLEQLIHSASAWIENTTGRKFKLRDYNGEEGEHEETAVPDEEMWVFSGDTLDNGGHTLLRNFRGVVVVPNFPIVGDITIETLLDRQNETWDEEIEENRDFTINRKTGEIILLAGGFGPGVHNYRITYSAGYEDIPHDLQQLCIDLVSLIFKDRRNLQSERIGAWSRTWDMSREDPIFAGTLSRYTRFKL
jgi:hypothetical protein